MDAVFYLLDAMRLFRGKSLPEIQEITFEIGMLVKYGLDINDPQESHVLRTLTYAGFKWIEPGMDIGGGPERSGGMAERLMGEKTGI